MKKKFVYDNAGRLVVKYSDERDNEIYNDAIDLIKKMDQELEEMKSSTWCAYCGHMIKLDDETATKISEHIMSCEKHPIHITLEKIKSLENALSESLKLQSHYAVLLNQYDGGARRVFGNNEVWIKRLAEVSAMKTRKA